MTARIKPYEPWNASTHQLVTTPVASQVPHLDRAVLVARDELALVRVQREVVDGREVRVISLRRGGSADDGGSSAQEEAEPYAAIYSDKAAGERRSRLTGHPRSSRYHPRSRSQATSPRSATPD